MSLRSALALLLSAACLDAHPGEPLAAFRPFLAAPAPAPGACVDAAGRICLFGGFANVDGVETGGVVRLTADGEVETILAENLVVPPFAAGWLAFPFGDPQSVGMLPLSDGRILLAEPRVGNALVSPDGAVESGFLNGIETGIEVFPQFERDGFLIVIVRQSDGSRRLARQSIAADSWAPEFMEWHAGWLPPAAAIPGPGGAIRVLGVRPKPQQYSFQIEPFLEHAVFRIDPIGVPTSADPLVLPDNRPATLHATDHGGYRLHFGATIQSVLMWPFPEAARTHIEWRDGRNDLLRTRTFTSPLGVPFVIAEEADGALLATAPDGRLMRYLAGGEPDPDFSPLAPVSHILQLPDGGFLLDGTRRIHAGGGVDMDWQAPLLEKPAAVAKMIVGHDGRVFVAGDFHRAGLGKAKHLAVLDAAGEISAGFAPELPAPVRDMTATTDGGLLVACSQPVTSPGGGSTNLLRLHADGSIDPSFAAGSPANIAAGGTADTVTAMPDGRILVTYFDRSPALATASLAALLPDGSPDPNFEGVAGYHSPLPKPLVLPDGRFFLGSVLHSGDGSVLSSVAPGNHRHSHRPLCRMPDGAVIFLESSWPAPRLLRWKNGGWDPGFTAEITDVAGAHPAAHGKLYVWGTSFGVARLHRNGRIDVTFRAPILENCLRRSPADWQTLGPVGIVPLGAAGQDPGTVATAILHPSTGDLWIAGSFNRVSGEPRDGIAALDASNPTGFAEWITAALRNAPGHQAPAADPDGDDIPNWLEYATGSDPLRPEPHRASLQPVPGDPGSFTISRNPEAPEVIALIEVSDDLAAWRIADGSEISIHAASPQLTFTLLPAAGPRFARVRFSDISHFWP